MLQKIKDISKFLMGEYTDLRPDIKNLMYVVRMRKQLAKVENKATANRLANDFLEMDLQEPFTDPNNARLARQILHLESMTSPDDVKKVQYLVNLNNNYLIDLVGI